MEKILAENKTQNLRTKGNKPVGYIVYTKELIKIMIKQLT